MRTEAREAQTCASVEASSVQAAWLEQGPTRSSMFPKDQHLRSL